MGTSILLAILAGYLGFKTIMVLAIILSVYEFIGLIIMVSNSKITQLFK